MQVPEKLALIGGSILLSSALIFTLKSQASSILPRISNGTSTIFKGDDGKSNDHQNKDNQNPHDDKADQRKQAEQAFNDKYQQAQQKHWTTGVWGTAKYYIDDGMNLHIGSGQLQGTLKDTIDSNEAQHLKTINIDDKVQAPKNSSDLFAGDIIEHNTTNQINGLDKLDTSQVTDMYMMFAYYGSLRNLDLSHWDTSHVTNMGEMFYESYSFSNVNLSSFNTSHVTNMNGMFDGDNSLSSLDLSHFDTSSVTNMGEMFDNCYHLHQLILSPNAEFQNRGNSPDNIVYLSGTYQNGSQVLSADQLMDGNVHPGTWTNQ